MRLSRPCYDKPHRCPGWAGGGLKYARVDRCDNGSIQVQPRIDECLLVADDEFVPHPGAHPFRFGHCTKCDVVTLPWATRRLDPTWILDRIRLRIQRLKWRIEDWRADRRP